ncbi:MAG: hypothetical protein QGG36_29845 [Pirellulaceae bacterium]|jgi:hypothetical protein|nr:hypothetical protein [Pirellulaceae bacterium]MDP7020039.1 hypothetical protein [Pirellulaceae bacterium]
MLKYFVLGAVVAVSLFPATAEARRLRRRGCPNGQCAVAAPALKTFSEVAEEEEAANEATSEETIETTTTNETTARTARRFRWLRRS